MDKRFNSVWDALYDDPDETADLKKRSGYMILIQARLYGLSGSKTDKAIRFDFTDDQIQDLLAGKIDKFSLGELVAIARKIGVTVRL